MHLNLFDWAIILLYIVLIFYSGIFMKKYVGNIGDFLVANRSMGFHLGMLSLMCTEIAMITSVYYAELGYKAGLGRVCFGLCGHAHRFFYSKLATAAK